MENNIQETNELSRANLDNRVAVEEEKGITLSQIWHMIIKHWVAIVILALIGLAVGVVYARAVKKPKFKAESQVMVLTSDSTLTQAQKISLSESLVRICYGYMSGPEVSEAALEYLVNNNKKFVNENGKAIYDSVDFSKMYTVSMQFSTTNVPTIFIKVSATTSNKEMSIAIANAVVTVTAELCNTDGQVSSYLKDCVVPTETDIAKDSSTSNLIIAAVGVLGGVVLGVAYAIVRELLNNRVGSKMELEQITGFKVIGMIPKYSNAPLSPEKQNQTTEGEKQDA